MEQKRIALVTSYYQERGYGGNEYYMAKYLTEQGHKVFIYGSKWSIPRYDNFRKIDQECSLSGVTLRRLPSVIINKKKGMAWIFGLRKQAKKDKIDLVHVQEWFLPCAWPFLGFHPLLLTQRIADYPFRLKVFAKVFGHYILKHADHINSLTSTGKKEMVKYCNTPEEKVAVISNGVNVELFKPSEHALKKKEEETMFVYVGRVDSEKGVDVIIEACTKLTIPYKVYIIGLGVWLEDMKKLAKEKKVDDKVTFLGKIEHVDLASYYSSADCCIIPSKIEPFGFVTLEALSCGSPVIGSDIGGMKDVIIPEVGLKVPPSNPEALAEAMIKMSDAAFRETLKPNCRKHILDNYAWDVVIKKNPLYKMLSKG